MTRMQTRAALLRNAAQLDMFAALDAPLADRDQVDIRDVLARAAPAPAIPPEVIAAATCTRPRYTRQPGELDRIGEEHAIAAREAFWEIVEEAWAALDQFDRLMRTEGSDAALASGALDTLEECRRAANDGEQFGLRVNIGPKRLMKALRIRARATGRWPMWGVEGRFRFDWRGLTMIGEMGWLGPSISLDRDRHLPGTLCHSETGYRSFLRGLNYVPSGIGTPQDWMRGLLDHHLAAPPKDGNGLGGKLVRYVPFWMGEWRSTVERLAELTPEYEAQCPGMTHPGDRPAYWAQWRANAAQRIASLDARMRALGIDPYVFFPEVAPARQGGLL